MSYDPTSNSFKTEYRTTEEQIDRYNVVDGQLLVPGTDPQEDWALGNWYRVEGGSWVKHRTIPNMVHTFDMISFAGKLFAAGGAQSLATSQVQVSSDGGSTWVSSNIIDPFRSYSFLTMNGQLYLTRGFELILGEPAPAVYQYTGGTSFTPLNSIKFTQMFPSTSKSGIDSAKIIRSMNVLGTTVYIGARAVNDQQNDPFGLYVSSSIGNARRVSLPQDGKPRDMKLGNDGALYVLTTIKQADGRHRMSVVRTTDLAVWTEMFSFTQNTFARSFEQIGDTWYFGLGQDADGNAAETGQILRFKP